MFWSNPLTAQAAKSWRMQSNDAMQFSEFDYLLMNSLSNISQNENENQNNYWTKPLPHYLMSYEINHMNDWHEKCVLLFMCSYLFDCLLNLSIWPLQYIILTNSVPVERKLNSFYCEPLPWTWPAPSLFWEEFQADQKKPCYWKLQNAKYKEMFQRNGL